MHNFQKQVGRNPRRAVDGFLNAPSRPQVAQPALGHDRHGLGHDRFRSTSGRRLDDFSRREGYHPTTRSVSPQLSPQAGIPKSAAQANASILHMTLPGGALDTKKTKGKRKTKDKPQHHSRWHSVRKWGIRSAIVVSVLVLLGGGFLITKGILKVNKVFKGGGTAAALQENVRPELLKGEGDGRINVLLLGKGGGNHEGPDLTDTLLVASIDPINKTANLVSIPRDLWVTVPGYGSSKINAVYPNAKYRALNSNPKDAAGAEKQGITAIEQVVTQVLGIPIHYYTMVDFQAFQQAVDAVGGIDIDVPSDLVDYNMAWENNGNPTLAKKGLQHFDGKKALMYVRSRYGSARGDFDRTERQRLFIQALSQKILSAGTYTNPVKLSQLLSAFGDHVSTDFSVNDALRMMTIGKDITGNKISSTGLADPPNNFVVTDNMNGASIVRPSIGIGDYSQIQAYIRTTLKDPFIAKENAALQILNGTSVEGLATAMSDKLKSYGYNVIKIGDAPTKKYTKTILVDTTGGKKPYTKNYLEKRLDVKAVTKLPDSAIQAQGSDFVIILGQDEASNSKN